MATATNKPKLKQRKSSQSESKVIHITAIFDAEHLAADVAEPPKHVASTITSIVRDTAVIKQLKELYNHRCQVCGATIPVADGQPYSEGHHLKPLGSPHNGIDNPANVLVLCPNHHAMFDLGTLAIDPADGRTLLHIDPTAKEHGRKLRVKHHIAGANIVYHYEKIWRGSKK